MISTTNYRRRTSPDIVLPGAAPYNVVVDGETKIPAFTPTSPFYTFGCVKAPSGKYFFGLMGRDDKNRDPYIYRYNPTTNLIEQEHRIVIGVDPADGDNHRVPNLEVETSTGHIYMICETLGAISGQSHGSNMLIYKTTVAGDVSTLTLIKTITGCWTYPFIRVEGSNVFVCARGANSILPFIRGEQWYYKSTDGGANWDSGTRVYDSPDEQKVSYVFQMYDHNGNIYLVLNERDNDLENWTFVSVIKGSFGSHVWTNIDVSFSKNVSSSGAITRAEMIANCLVYESANYSTEIVNFEGGIIKSDGSIHMLISLESLTGNTYLGNPEGELEELRFYTFSGGSWSYNNIDLPVSPMQFYWAYERLFLFLNNDESGFNDVLFIDKTDSNKLYIKRSTDNFATESQTLYLAGDGLNRMGQIAFNVDTEEEYLFIVVNTQGDPFEITSEGPEDYSNITVLKPID
jgi:hypothetical protein